MNIMETPGSRRIYIKPEGVDCFPLESDFFSKAGGETLLIQTAIMLVLAGYEGIAIPSDKKRILFGPYVQSKNKEITCIADAPPKYVKLVNSLAEEVTMLKWSKIITKYRNKKTEIVLCPDIADPSVWKEYFNHRVRQLEEAMISQASNECYQSAEEDENQPDLNLDEEGRFFDQDPIQEIPDEDLFLTDQQIKDALGKKNELPDVQQSSVEPKPQRKKHSSNNPPGCKNCLLLAIDNGHKIDMQLARIEERIVELSYRSRPNTFMDLLTSHRFAKLIMQLNVDIESDTDLEYAVNTIAAEAIVRSGNYQPENAIGRLDMSGEEIVERVIAGLTHKANLDDNVATIMDMQKKIINQMMSNAPPAFGAMNISSTVVEKKKDPQPLISPKPMVVQTDNGIASREREQTVKFSAAMFKDSLN